jgi:hypothetical protein
MLTNTHPFKINSVYHPRYWNSEYKEKYSPFDFRTKLTMKQLVHNNRIQIIKPFSYSKSIIKF